MNIQEATKTNRQLLLGDSQNKGIQKSMGIGINSPISPEALLVACAYEGDVVWMVRNGKKTGGDMGLPLPDGTDVGSIDTLPTKKITSIKGQLRLIQEQQALIETRLREIYLFLEKFGVRSSYDESVEIFGDISASLELNDFDILTKLSSDRFTQRELIVTYQQLEQAKMRGFRSIRNRNEFIQSVQGSSEERLRMATNIEAEIVRSSIDISQITKVLGIPVVGFGNQTKVLNQTARYLEEHSVSSDTLIILNVNYPQWQVPDDTYQNLLELQSRLRKEGKKVVVVQSMTLGTVLEQGKRKVMIGDIRSSIFDGFLLARDQWNSLEKIVFFSTDDDNSQMPEDWIERNEELLQKPDVQLVVTPVDFDGEGDQGNREFPNFYITENLRRIIANDKLEFLTNLDQIDQKRVEDLGKILKFIFGGKIAGYIEPVILSSQAFRANEYIKVGGYPPRDEIIKMTRLLILNNLIEKGKTGVALLPGNERITTDNKRQLQAYLLTGAPSVAAWKTNETKFIADEVDPVRLGAFSIPDKQRDLQELDYALSSTFEYMGINDLEEIQYYLQKRGFDLSKVTIRQFSSTFGFAFD